MSQFHMYNVLIGGLSKTSYPSEGEAKANAAEHRNNHPALAHLADTDTKRFVKVYEITTVLTEKERVAWKPPFVTAEW